MNRKMLMLGTFLSTSLLVTNTLQVVSCKRKGVEKVGNNNEEEKTAQQVELETAVKLKTEIRNAIDEIVTNPIDNDWIIDFIVNFTDQYSDIISKLNSAITDAIKDKTNKIAFNKISNLDETLIEAVKLKFASLKEIIMEQIERNAIELGASNFKFEFDLESILPMLTTLTGTQVLEVVNRLKGLKNSKPTFYSANLDVVSDVTEIENINQINLFKVTTDLKYNFSFGSKQYIDSYNNCELFLTEDSKSFKKLNRFTQETIAEIINNDEEAKNIQIYDGNTKGSVVKEYLQNFEYIGKQMDWDFSKQEVKDEIKQMQYDKIRTSPRLKSIIDDLDFDINNFEFETLNYMNFTNNNLSMKSISKDCILVCDGKIMKRNDVLQNIEKQYGLDENGSLKKGWDGGKINKQFVERIKQDAINNNLRFDYSKYYGLGEFNDLLSDFLVGYGTTAIRRAYYANIPLSTLDITTVLTSPYDGAGMLDLYRNLKEYLGVMVNVAWNENGEDKTKGYGLSIIRGTIYAYFMIWKFSNPGEWETIEKQLEENNGEVTFDWIMEEVLLEKRILKENSNYKLSKDIKDFKPKTSLKSKREIKYVKHKSHKSQTGLVEKDKTKNSFESAAVYIKYGPFVTFLNDDDSLSYWEESQIAIGL